MGRGYILEHIIGRLNSQLKPESCFSLQARRMEGRHRYALNLQGGVLGEWLAFLGQGCTDVNGYNDRRV